MGAARDPLEARFFEEQAEVDQKALILYEEDPREGAIYLTEYSLKCQADAMDLYKELQKTLITKYTNNKQGL